MTFLVISHDLTWQVDILHSCSITRNSDSLLVRRFVPHDLTRRLICDASSRRQPGAGDKRDVCLPDYHLIALLLSVLIWQMSSIGWEQTFLRSYWFMHALVTKSVLGVDAAWGRTSFIGLSLSRDCIALIGLLLSRGLGLWVSGLQHIAYLNNIMFMF